MADFDPKTELDLAMSAVRTAAAVCQQVQRNLVSAATLQKRDRSPVTVADFASQAIVCAALAQDSRVTRIVAEESADNLRKKEAEEQRDKVWKYVREACGAAVSLQQVLDWIDLGASRLDTERGAFWTLDPIDGTKGFLRGEQYAIALALLEHGRVELAVLCCPNLKAPDGSRGVVLSAIRGGGAEQQPLESRDANRACIRVRDTVRVRATEALSEARFCESVESGHSDQRWTAQVACRLGITAPPLRADSQAKYALVARGDASIYLRLPARRDYQEKIWDHASGALLVEEAGGTVTDVYGRALDFAAGPTLARNTGVIASDGAFHALVLQAVQSLEDGR